MKTVIARFKDDYHNSARIEPHSGPAYYNGPVVFGYRLVLSADYDKNTVYHVSMHESIKDAMNVLNSLSCGTFKLV